MKSAKPLAADAPSHRRSQPVRQTRTNPPRNSANPTRGGRESPSGSGGDQPIDIFPAITFFADTISALPKELVRHFTLLREVDAKICGPEEQLFQLVAAAVNSPLPDPKTSALPSNDNQDGIAPASTPMGAPGSSTAADPSSSVAGEPSNLTSPVFDPSNLPRRQLFRQTAIKIQEMLVSLEEKNHVIGTANEALEKQLARIEDVWPHLENEFSDEAKWGSTTHWAYPENRAGKSSHPERARRDGAAAISAAAQALADEAAARSDARKQAVQAKKNLKNNHQDSDLDDVEHRNKVEGGKKSHSKVRKTAEGNAAVGLGITSAPNGNPPPKKRKVEKVANGGGAMSTVFGSTATKGKASSPHETPAPEGGPKKRKALPTASGQAAKKKNGAAMSPSAASSPVLSALSEPKGLARASPAPNNNGSRPATSRARQNSLQSGPENGKARPPSSASNKTNGAPPANHEPVTITSAPRPSADLKAAKEPSVPVKPELTKRESDKGENGIGVGQAAGKKENKTDDSESRKSEPVPPITLSAGTVTTKSGRASKPSTPALATFQEVARPKTGRSEGSNSKKSHKKSGSTAQALLPPPPVDDGATSGDGENDADERYCYCNGVSYGQMVACDSEDCTREWFHLACVGLRTPPAEESTWYCPDCKERLKIGGKRLNGR